MHEKAAESQTGDDRVDAVTLHKLFVNQKFLGVKASEHSALCTKHYEVKLSHKIVFRLSVFRLLTEG